MSFESLLITLTAFVLSPRDDSLNSRKRRIVDAVLVVNDFNLNFSSLNGTRMKVCQNLFGIP